jgi:xanthine dehydrogenase accessory factor
MITGALRRRAEELEAARLPFVEATVVGARRPASVRPGATAIVGADGRIDGFIGGVCAEESVKLHALRVMESGEPLLLRILPGEGDADAEAPAAEGAVTVENPCLSGGALEIFLEPHLPAPTVLVVGDTPITEALADLGARIGYAVITSDEGIDEPDSNATAVVVASHGKGEERTLAAALQAGVPYVALVASAQRGASVRDALDVPEELRDEVRTPAGLDIGARTPAEIALAILAEIVASRSPAPTETEAPAAVDRAGHEHCH